MSEFAERIADAEAARAALDRWLGPAFAVVEQDYLDRLTELAATQPWEDKKITKVAMGLKIARLVRQQIEAVALDGKVARHQDQYAKQIEQVPHQKRLWGVG